MKKILIIENRHKTKFWSEIIDPMVFDKVFLIQNHRYALSDVRNVLIPYYRFNLVAETYMVNPSLQFHRKIVSKRVSINKRRLVYYYNEIFRIIRDENPDLILGESTAIHELIAIDVAKQLGIDYVNLVSARYPPGKFLIVSNDTLKLRIQNYGTAPRVNISREVKSGLVSPDYMKKIRKKHRIDFTYQINNLMDWFLGERLNTPSPFLKFSRELDRVAVKLLLVLFSRDGLGGFVNEAKSMILYPMQMQPESNIDVWGFKYKNQANLITTVARKMRKQEVLLVKINPKMKYELTVFEFFNIIRHNVVFLNSSVRMSDLLDEVEGVITVTGTVFYEAILKGVKVCLLSYLPLSDKLGHYSDVDSFLEGIRQNENSKAKEIIGLLDEISFEGVIGDASYKSNAMAILNINKIKKVISDEFGDL